MVKAKSDLLELVTHSTCCRVHLVTITNIPLVLVTKNPLGSECCNKCWVTKLWRVEVVA